MYLYKRVRTPHRDFITRTKCFYYNPPAARQKRGVRRYKTGESKEQRNKRNAYLKRKYQIYNNFDLGDMWITLTYFKDSVPENPEDAHKNLMYTLSKVQKRLKKQNIPFVFYVKTEAGEGIRAHHHLFIKNNFEVIDTLYSYWKEYGKVKDFSQIYEMESGRLVTYFLDCEHKGLNFEKYSHSRNLKAPETEIRIMPFGSFRENPKLPAPDDDGTEYVIQNLYNGYSDIDGYVYQEYELVKVKRREIFKE